MLQTNAQVIGITMHGSTAFPQQIGALFLVAPAPRQSRSTPDGLLVLGNSRNCHIFILAALQSFELIQGAGPVRPQEPG
jgi:hypothetical protein